MTLAEMGRPGPGPYRLILSQDPIAVHVRVGRARLTATAHATRTTRFGEQVLVSLSGCMTWVSAHRFDYHATWPEDGAATPAAEPAPRSRVRSEVLSVG